MVTPAVQCEFCKRRFARTEHLERHRRIRELDPPALPLHPGHGDPGKRPLVYSTNLDADTGEKPYACEHCGETFARNDICQRHIHQQHSELPARKAKRQRTRIACDDCHSRKLKCDSRSRPCERCRLRQVVCTFDRENRVSTARPPASTSSDPLSGPPAPSGVPQTLDSSGEEEEGEEQDEEEEPISSHRHDVEQHQPPLPQPMDAMMVLTSAALSSEAALPVSMSMSTSDMTAPAPTTQGRPLHVYDAFDNQFTMLDLDTWGWFNSPFTTNYGNDDDMFRNLVAVSASISPVLPLLARVMNMSTS